MFPCSRTASKSVLLAGRGLLVSALRRRRLVRFLGAVLVTEGSRLSACGRLEPSADDVNLSIWSIQMEAASVPVPARADAAAAPEAGTPAAALKAAASAATVLAADEGCLPHSLRHRL